MPRSKDRIFLLVLFASPVFGFLILNDYSESWDEHLQYKQYASHALESYGVWFREGRAEGQWGGGNKTTGIVRDFHGPSFVTVSELFARFAPKINPSWPRTDLHHFVHFLAFQVVTVGQEATERFDKLQAAHDYTEAYYTHGLAVQAAEATADYLHEHSRREIGIAENQGKRYSWGYPAIPELEDHTKILELLPAVTTELGMSLSAHIS